MKKKLIALATKTKSSKMKVVLIDETPSIVDNLASRGPIESNQVSVVASVMRIVVDKSLDVTGWISDPTKVKSTFTHTITMIDNIIICTSLYSQYEIHFNTITEAVNFWNEYMKTSIHEYRDYRVKSIYSVKLSGPDGNIYSVLVNCIKLVWSQSEQDVMKTRVLSSTSYENALAVISEYVKIEDTSDPKIFQS